MQAFLNDKELKEKMVKEVKWHQEQDAIIQGTYGSNGQYCAVGCSLHSLNKINKTRKKTDIHTRYETELGIPESIARLEDRIFEGLTVEEAKLFPLKFIESVNVGADLSMVTNKFVYWLLTDPEGIVKNAFEDGKKAIDVIARLYLRTLEGEVVSDDEWSAARSAAGSAESAARSSAGSAESAAWSAARSAESAAWSAAWSARSAAWSARSAAWSARSAAGSAESAAWSAAGSAAGSAARSARSAEYKKMSEKLLELLREAI